MHVRRGAGLRAAACAALGLAAGACLAQAGAPPGAPAGTLPRTEELRRGSALDAPRATDPALEVAPQPRREIEDAPGLAIDVERFRLIGLTRVATDEIEPALARYLGPGKSFQDLRDAVDEVKSQLAARGLPLAYVYLPEQEVRDGVVEIAVIEGRLGRVLVEVAPGAPVGEAVIGRYAQRLVPGSVIAVRNIERVLFLLRDLYGIEVRSEFRSGAEPGTADLVIRASPARRVDALAELDNAGARFTGEHRATLGARISSPLGLGDSLSARYIGSFGGGIGIGLLSYAAPVGTAGTKLGATYTSVRYEIGAGAVGVPIEGRGHVGTLFGLHPIVRSRNMNLFAQASFDAKRFREHTGDARTTRSIDLLGASLVGDWADRLLGGAVNSFSIALAGGRVERPFIDRPVPPGIDRRFGKAALAYTRLQQLPPERTLLLLRYAGQLAAGNLDPFEQFSLGGPGGVRAYAVAEAPGDEGHLLSAELRWSPDKKHVSLAGNLALQLFYDWGMVRRFNDPLQAGLPAGLANRRSLGGPGLGVLWEVPGRFVGRASLAWPTVGHNENDRQRRLPRLYFTLSTAF